MNRKDLFDMGVAGPLAGFAVTLVVLVIGFLSSVPVTAEEAAAIDVAFPGMTGTLAVPLLFQLMELLFIDFIPPGGTLYIHPIAFASWVGMLITALNLFPASQLDGGHALRAIVNSKEHKFIGWAAILIMALMGYFPMALLVLIISSQGAHPGALNDTIPLSKSRVALFIIAMIILILTIPPISLSFF
jgi:membrane-associated protease RseP (regulator of RpoE activity)